MKALINELQYILQDYQQGSPRAMTPGRIEKWIDQFDEDDRKFILTELVPILKERYVSKENIKTFIKSIIGDLQKNYKYKTPQEFLLDVVFLDLQEKGKSQGAMLELLDEILRVEFGVKLKDCGSANQKYHIYLDDILCTGNTFFNDIQQWAGTGEGSNEERVRKGQIELIACFVFIHSANYHKVKSRFKREISTGFASRFELWYHKEIDNSDNPGSSYGTLMPVAEDQSEEVEQYQEKIIAEVEAYTKGKYQTKENFYRDNKRPKLETLFSSAENRIRFENILLEKGIDMLSKANRQKENIRALGYDLRSHKTFGFGTICFTWRNVPNNTPLVFWYSGGGFYPLFEKNKAMLIFDFL